MTMTNNGLNSLTLDSFFQEGIIDNNGVYVTDLNAGVVNLFGQFRDAEQGFHESQLYLATEQDEGFPDLVAKSSILGSGAYWWWILMLNNLENPLKDIKANWIYAINSKSMIDNFVNTTNSAASAGSNGRLGNIVELN